MNFMKSKFNQLQNNIKMNFYNLKLKHFTVITETKKEQVQKNQGNIDRNQSNPTITSNFKLRPEDIDDYIIIGSEIFKNAFKESILLSEKEPDIAKRTEILMRELDSKPHVYGNLNFDFKFSEPKEKYNFFLNKPKSLFRKTFP